MPWPNRPLHVYGLVVHRADLRTFPTRERVFNSASADDTDIDRFQESALFPGTPVVIAHTSADGAWYFVVSPLPPGSRSGMSPWAAATPCSPRPQRPRAWW